jgi:hypothetical protein
MAVETTEQIVREAPEIEAIKLELLGEASRLARGKDAAGQDLLTNKRFKRVYLLTKLQAFPCSAGRTSGRHATGRWKFSALH